MKVIRILLGILLALGMLADKPIAFLLIGSYFGILMLAERTNNKRLVKLLSSEEVKPATTKQFIAIIIFSLAFIITGIAILSTNGMRLW